MVPDINVSCTVFFICIHSMTHHYFLTLVQGVENRHMLKCCFISHDGRARLLPVVHFNPTHPVFFFGARLCWMKLNRPSAPHIFKARYGQSAAWRPTDPAHLWVSVQGLLFGLTPPPPPKGFYPFIQAWDQNSRSGLGSVSRSVVSDIYWSVSLHLSFSSLALLIHQTPIYPVFFVSSLSWMSDTSEIAFD